MKYTLLLALVLVLTQSVDAQVRRKAPKKDSLTIMPCLLNGATIPPPEKQAYDLGVSEPSLEIVSNTDSVIKAPLDITVTTIQRGEDGSMEMVFYYQDYYFTISGITKVEAKKNQKFKKGDRIAYQALGKKIEIMIYDFETPMDPKKYFECGK